jgi:hypothetical protein
VREEHRLKGLKTKCGGEYPQPKEMRKQRAAETYIMRALINSVTGLMPAVLLWRTWARCYFQYILLNSEMMIQRPTGKRK